MRKWIVGLMLGSASLGVWAQNLIADPNFDQGNVANWSAPLVWDASQNKVGAAGSGSGSITNTTSSNVNSYHACIPGAYPAQSNWTYGTWIRKANAPTDSAALVGVAFYSTNNCTASAVIGATSTSPSTTGVWTWEGGTVTLPSNANSALFYFNTNTTGTPFTANFDGVLFEQTGAVCVSTAAQLQAALTSAQTDNQDNYIKLVTGTYNLASPINITVTDGHALSVEGGYGAGCATPMPGAIPNSTIISGAAGSYLQLVSDGGGLVVRNLTLTGFSPAAGISAIQIIDYGLDDTLRAENLIVSGNSVNGINDSTLHIQPAGGLIFDDNVVHDNANAHAAVLVDASYPYLPFVIANNTVAHNQSPGLALDVISPFRPVALYNNILWNNATNDLSVTNSVVLALNNTWFNSSFDNVHDLDPASANNQTTNPQLTASYSLADNSPAIDNGLPLPLVLPATDAANYARVINNAPSQGAYESHLFVEGEQLVTSAADSGPHTLRQAILDANASGVPTSIPFLIGTSCPQLITLGSPLPHPTVSLQIDGYTQTGASVNNIDDFGRPPYGGIGSNAKICIIVLGGFTPTVDSALVVDNTAPQNVHVEVQGLEFENFKKAAIQLSGGSGHWIHGNAFGVPLNSTGGVLPNDIGVQVDGGVATVIGGPSPADINLLGNSTGTDGLDILVTNTYTAANSGFNTIISNSIGGGANGLGAGSQKKGIEILNSNQNVISSNWIVSNGGDAISLDGASSTLVQSNRLGALAGGLGNAGAGVHLVNGATINWIGSTNPATGWGANFIENNTGPGVWVDSTAGYYNQISGNSIFSNGGIAVDIGLSGPSANIGIENGGPNKLLHKPVLANAVAGAGGTITVTGTIAGIAANAYRPVSVYASHACGGNAEVLLGTAQLQADANGNISLNLQMPSPAFTPAYINALDADLYTGINDTSEISNSKKLTVSDGLFNDSFDCY